MDGGDGGEVVGEGVGGGVFVGEGGEAVKFDVVVVVDGPF